MRILYRFHGWLVFAPTALGGYTSLDSNTLYTPLYLGQTYGQTNMKREITLAKINHLWNRYNMHMLISWPTKIPKMNKMRQKTIFGILVGHDLSMCILYWFHRWLIFARVISLFMFVWPYVRSHILCTQLVICLLSHFIHIWYLDNVVERHKGV
jgi:hypothetical protein